jgi:hypothetical protein
VSVDPSVYWLGINDLGPQKVFALVTDNAANMKAAWSKVEESYPHVTPIGCAAHALNLLLKDSMALKTMDALYKRATVCRLVKYTSKQGLWDGDAIWQSCQHISSATWWKRLCGSEALSPVASIILQIPPTSAASERNWSFFGNTHQSMQQADQYKD